MQNFDSDRSIFIAAVTLVKLIIIHDMFDLIQWVYLKLFLSKIKFQSLCWLSLSRYSSPSFPYSFSTLSLLFSLYRHFHAFAVMHLHVAFLFSFLFRLIGRNSIDHLLLDIQS